MVLRSELSTNTCESLDFGNGDVKVDIREARKEKVELERDGGWVGTEEGENGTNSGEDDLHR